MATEEQELRLKVVLDDQASATLAQLKSNITQLTSGQAAASMEKFKRGQAEIGEGIKKLTELATGGERALLGLIGKFGAMGAVAAGVGTVLTETALKMANLAEKAKLIGISPATMKNMVDQLERAGVSSDKAAESVAGFVDALADLSRVGSERHQKALEMAGTHKADMIASIAQLEKLTTMEQKFNWAQQQAENVRRYRYETNIRQGKEETVAQADAAKAANYWLETMLKMDETTRLLGPHMHEMTKEQEEEYKRLAKRSEEAKKSFVDLMKAAEGVGEALINAFGPTLSKILKQDAEDIEWIVKGLHKIEDALPSWMTGKQAESGGPGGGFTDEMRKQGADALRSGQGTRLAPNGSSVGPGTGAGAGATTPSPGGGVTPGAPPVGSGGGSGGITAPAGTPIQHGGMATVTSASGHKYQVDARYAQNFQGFINDYEKAGGVIGPNTGTLGERPSNASGHPIGAAIDINQVARNVRRGGVSLPPETEHALAAKWGMVSGADWRNPDAGHFGVKSVDAAKQALIDQGLTPDQATAAVTGKPDGKEVGRTAKGSWFGSTPGWSDPSEPPGRRTAGGFSNQVPGIALPDRSGLGKMYEVTTPDGRKFMLPQTDVGPAARTGRGIDITSAAATKMGYTAKNFPTDQGFSFRRVGDDRAAVDPMGDARQRLADSMRERFGTAAADPMSDARQRLADSMRERFDTPDRDAARKAIDDARSQNVNVTGNGKLTANINAPPGTSVNVEGDGLFKKTEVNRQTQMAPAAVGPPASTFSERFSGER